KCRPHNQKHSRGMRRGYRLGQPEVRSFYAGVTRDKTEAEKFFACNCLAGKRAGAGEQATLLLTNRRDGGKSIAVTLVHHDAGDGCLEDSPHAFRKALPYVFDAGVRSVPLAACRQDLLQQLLIRRGLGTRARWLGSPPGFSSRFH